MKITCKGETYADCDLLKNKIVGINTKIIQKNLKNGYIILLSKDQQLTPRKNKKAFHNISSEILDIVYLSFQYLNTKNKKKSGV